MKKIVLYGCLMSSLGIFAESGQKAVIWDLGGVLFTNSRLTYVHAIGFKPIFSYLFTERTRPWKSSSIIQKRTFDVLSTIPLEEAHTAKGACVPGGMSMPPLLWAFQAGLIAPDICLERAEKALEVLDQQGYFKNSSEKELIRRIICVAFTPSLSVLSCSVRTESMKLVKQLAAQRNSDGTQKYKLIVLSNWDPWSFNGDTSCKDCIRNKFHTELSYFDDVIISGDVHLMKPMPQIFSHVLEKHGLLKENCTFIDDQLENIQSARAFGIKNPVHFTDSRSLRQQLRSLKIV